MTEQDTIPDHTDDHHDWKLRTAYMPDEMQILLNDYPREAWDDQPGFRDKTKQC